MKIDTRDVILFGIPSEKIDSDATVACHAVSFLSCCYVMLRV